jgi:hypothetical protein
MYGRQQYQCNRELKYNIEEYAKQVDRLRLLPLVSFLAYYSILKTEAIYPPHPKLRALNYKALNTSRENLKSNKVSPAFLQ